MFALKPRKRVNFTALAKHMKYFRPKRCKLSGETEKHQTPYPPPWMSMKRPNVVPKIYPLEIDHINEWEIDNRPANLRFLTKTYHVLKSAESIYPRPRRGPTQARIFPKPRVVIDKMTPKIHAPNLF